MANQLPAEKRVRILFLLLEGNSMRGICRMEKVNWRTVAKLQNDAARAARRYHRKYVAEVSVDTIQIDELWSFCYAKQHRLDGLIDPPEEAGDVWTWLAIESDTRHRALQCAPLSVELASGAVYNMPPPTQGATVCRAVQPDRSGEQPLMILGLIDRLGLDARERGAGRFRACSPHRRGDQARLPAAKRASRTSLTRRRWRSTRRTGSRPKPSTRRRGGSTGARPRRGRRRGRTATQSG